MNNSKQLSEHQQPRTAQYESDAYLTIGNYYGVVGMAVLERALFFLVKDDTAAPAFVQAGFFELFESRIPSEWEFKLEPGIRAQGRALWVEPEVAIWGYPELLNPNYVQSLLKREAEAVKTFESYLRTSCSV